VSDTVSVAALGIRVLERNTESHGEPFVTSSNETSGNGWKNRILGTGEEAPEQLLAHPLNFRRHPAAQRNALRGSLNTVGWVQMVVVNQRTGYVLDGHARIEEALSRHEKTIPVIYVDLDPEEERVVLASLDPIGAMAERDQERLDELLEDLKVDDAGLQALLDSLHISALPEPEKDSMAETPTDEVTCPSCGTTFNIGVRVKPTGKSPRGNEMAGGN
jgi:hypothetical protein